MDSSDFLKKQEEDKDIKLFQEEYPDVYELVLKLIDGKYDNEMVENFREEYGEEIYNDIQKIVDGELDDEEVRRLKEEYPEEIYIAIQKMIPIPSNSGDTILIFSSSFNIKLNMPPQNSKTASEFSKVSQEYRQTV